MNTYNIVCKVETGLFVEICNTSIQHAFLNNCIFSVIIHIHNNNYIYIIYIYNLLHNSGL